MAIVGPGYRSHLARWLADAPPEVECVELTAEHFFDLTDEAVHRAVAGRPVFVHGLGLSLASPGSPDATTLKQFRRIVRLADPAWISEHVAFTRTPEVDLGHLNPVAPTQDMLDRLSDNARALSEVCEKPLILENITSYVRLSGDMDEPEFLNALCGRAGCGLLLDVTNLFINSRNHGFDPVKWFQQIHPDFIVQLHIVGYSQRNGRWHDSHCERIQDDLLDLCQAVVEYAPVQAIILERDDPSADVRELADELRRLREICRDN